MSHLNTGSQPFSLPLIPLPKNPNRRERELHIVLSNKQHRYVQAYDFKYLTTKHHFSTIFSSSNPPKKKPKGRERWTEIRRTSRIMILQWLMRQKLEREQCINPFKLKVLSVHTIAQNKVLEKINRKISKTCGASSLTNVFSSWKSLPKRFNKGILTRLLNLLKVLTNISGSRWIPTQQPLTKIFVAWGITAGEISYNQEKAEMKENGKANIKAGSSSTEQIRMHLKILCSPFF